MGKQVIGTLLGSISAVQTNNPAVNPACAVVARPCEQFDEARRRVVVAGLVEGSAAEQRRRRASVDPQLCASTAQEGDVLRALTCTKCG